VVNLNHNHAYLLVLRDVEELVFFDLVGCTVEARLALAQLLVQVLEQPLHMHSTNSSNRRLLASLSKVRNEHLTACDRGPNEPLACWLVLGL
jgi:hypothetical protein